MASNRALRLLTLSCIKKVTVIGIIGKTQGVTIARRPAKNDIIKNIRSDFLSSFPILFGFKFVFCVAANVVTALPESTFFRRNLPFSGQVITAVIALACRVSFNIKTVINIVWGDAFLIIATHEFKRSGNLEILLA